MAWKKIPWSDEVAGLSNNPPNTIEPDDVAAQGVGGAASRDDHEHAIVSAEPTGAVAVSAAAAEGVGTSFVRHDHVHVCPATWVPTAHAASHKDGGGDELDVSELAGAIGGAGEIPETDGAAVTWVDPDTRYDPKAHAASHADGAADELEIDTLPGANGGAGEIIESDGLALSFVDPDARYDPKAHAASHKNAGGDELLLHELGEPTGNIDINDQRLVKLRLEAAANATGVAADGAIFFDTDDDHVYVYVA